MLPIHPDWTVFLATDYAERQLRDAARQIENRGTPGDAANIDEALDAIREFWASDGGTDALRRLGNAMVWLRMGEEFAKKVAVDICDAYVEAGFRLQDVKENTGPSMKKQMQPIVTRQNKVV